MIIKPLSKTILYPIFVKVFYNFYFSSNVARLRVIVLPIELSFDLITFSKRVIIIVIYNETLQLSLRKQGCKTT
jgi:hypothetical protein